jgi:hypothetical protein
MKGFNSCVYMAKPEPTDLAMQMVIALQNNDTESFNRIGEVYCLDEKARTRRSRKSKRSAVPDSSTVGNRERKANQKKRGLDQLDETELCSCSSMET